MVDDVGIYPEFRAWAGMMGGKEPNPAQTQTASYSGCHSGPAFSLADPKTAFDPNGLLDDLRKALAERTLHAEMDHHLAREETGNSRNGPWLV
jgi:hypothetical protein